MGDGHGTACTSACVAPSNTNAHCKVCHRTFGAVSAFDAHRKMIGGAKRGNRETVPAGPLKECADPASLGMVERGGIWRRTMSTEDRERRGFDAQP